MDDLLMVPSEVNVETTSTTGVFAQTTFLQVATAITTGLAKPQSSTDATHTWLDNLTEQELLALLSFERTNVQKSVRPLHSRILQLIHSVKGQNSEMASSKQRLKDERKRERREKRRARAEKQAARKQAADDGDDEGGAESSSEPKKVKQPRSH
ncbi:unnamed protein product, partial [Dibothriocephalus latus]